MNSPFGPNSSSCAAVGAYAGPPALFDRVKTKTCPLEFTATPGTSPKFVPAGSFRKSALGSNWMSGTACRATVGAAVRTTKLNKSVFIVPPRVGAMIAHVGRMTYLKRVLPIGLLVMLLLPAATVAAQGRGRGHLAEVRARSEE